MFYELLERMELWLGELSIVFITNWTIGASLRYEIWASLMAIELQQTTIGKRLKEGGDRAIQKWIDDQLYGKTVVIVLIGAKTAGRKWIKYEIKKAWEEGKGVLGIHIHNLKDKNGNQTSKGKNPFEDLVIGGTPMSNIIQTYDPTPWFRSTYEYIQLNMADWIETAIEIRGRNS